MHLHKPCVKIYTCLHSSHYIKSLHKFNTMRNNSLTIRSRIFRGNRQRGDVNNAKQRNCPLNVRVSRMNFKISIPNVGTCILTTYYLNIQFLVRKQTTLCEFFLKYFLLSEGKIQFLCHTFIELYYWYAANFKC